MSKPYNPRIFDSWTKKFIVYGFKYDPPPLNFDPPPQDKGPSRGGFFLFLCGENKKEGNFFLFPFFPICWGCLVRA